ncbi:hypothetical protein [Streptosporangium saharense]
MKITVTCQTYTKDHVPSHKGWPGGEPNSVREAYDAVLAEQAATKGGTK